MAENVWKLEWDKDGEREYEAGISRVVLYPQNDSGAYTNGEAWNGVTSYAENPSGAEENAIYADDRKYLSLISKEEYAASIGCYKYPEGFKACNGEKQLVKGLTVAQQTRKGFGLSYVTKKGNDLVGDDYGYKIHLVYGCKASVSSKSFETIQAETTPIEFSFDITTTPIPMPNGMKEAATLTIDSNEVDPEKLAALEAVLYGSESTEAELPLPERVVQILSA